MFCVTNVSLKRPRTKLTSSTIFSCIEAHLVPPLLSDCNVVAVRGIFRAENDDVTLQIAARRAQIEKKLQALPEVRYFHHSLIIDWYFHRFSDFMTLRISLRGGEGDTKSILMQNSKYQITCDTGPNLYPMLGMSVYTEWFHTGQMRRTHRDVHAPLWLGEVSFP